MRRNSAFAHGDLNTFEFKPVGQGLFYMGSLIHGCFNFVFDCGTESKQKYVRGQIDDFVASLGGIKDFKPTLDFVVISHLHLDHFSGLHYLLQKCDVKEIYLPYLGENEDVIRTTLALAVYGDIHEIEHEEEDTDRTLTLSLMCGLYGVEGFNDFRTYRERVVFINKEADNEERKVDDKIYSTVTKKFTPGMDYWQFTFIQSHTDVKKLELLGETLDKAFGVLNNRRLIELFTKSEKNIKDVKRIYEWIFGDSNLLNLTSIVLVHFPLYGKINRINPFEYSTIQNICDLQLHNIIYHSNECSVNTVASVLTGDATIDGYIAREIKSTLKEKEILVFQIPHHGSKDNWNSVKSNKIKACTNVISFGYGNRHKHPHVSVIDDSINNNIFYCLVTQDRSFIYTIE